MVQEVEQFEDFGYYVDERGIRHFGVIPKKPDLQMYIERTEYYDPYGIESSDPRLHEIYIQSGFYR